MSYSNENVVITTPGDGIDDNFSINFHYLQGETSVIQVELWDLSVPTSPVQTSFVLGVDYTIDESAYPDTRVLTTVPVPTGSNITIYRQTTPIQTTNFANGAFPAESVEEGLDKVAMQSQEQAYDLSRAILNNREGVQVTLDDLATQDEMDAKLVIAQASADASEVSNLASAASAAASEASNVASGVSAAASEVSNLASAASAVASAASAAEAAASAALANITKVVNTLVASNWATTTTPLSKQYREMAYGAGTFVAHTDNFGSFDKFIYSTNGISWTSATSNFGFDGNDLIFGNDLFVCVGSGISVNTDNIYTSPDGINWTIRTTAANHSLSCVAWGNGIFVALNNSRHYTSADGLTWTERTGEIDNEDWQDVVYDDVNNVFVATGNFNPPVVATSPDGRTWTNRSEPGSGERSLGNKAAGNGTIVAYALDNKAMYSTDGGVSWAVCSGIDAGASINNIVFGGEIFLASSTSGTGRLLTSPDGITWTHRTPANDAVTLSGVAYGDGRFCNVSSGTNTVAQYTTILSGIVE